MMPEQIVGIAFESTLIHIDDRQAEQPPTDNRIPATSQT